MSVFVLKMTMWYWQACEFHTQTTMYLPVDSFFFILSDRFVPVELFIGGEEGNEDEGAKRERSSGGSAFYSGCDVTACR